MKNSNPLTLLVLAHQFHLVLFCDHEWHLALQSTQEHLSVREMESIVFRTDTTGGANNWSQLRRCSALLQYCLKLVPLRHGPVVQLKVRPPPLLYDASSDIQEKLGVMARVPTTSITGALRSHGVRCLPLFNNEFGVLSTNSPLQKCPSGCRAG